MSPKMRVVRKVLVNKRTGERTACYIACRDDREPGRPRPLNARGTVSSDHHSNASSSSATTVEESFERRPATCDVVMNARRDISDPAVDDGKPRDHSCIPISVWISYTTSLLVRADMQSLLRDPIVAVEPLLHESSYEVCVVDRGRTTHVKK